MIALLGKLKIYGLIALAGLVGILVGALKYMELQRDKWKLRAEHLDAERRFRQGVDKADAEIESDTDARTQELADAIEQGKPVESLSDPDRW